ncbi:hypothetical protein Rhal01_03268 [Rubritalea halochordaticola]|uniref:Uncharacterized protein n=1 Tax=Rubritalea halochordaticola TaxID=714537 RepID=A0ABP9V4X9_9BACT
MRWINSLVAVGMLLVSGPLSAAPKVLIVPGEEIRPGESAVWSPLFQACWEEMVKQNGGLIVKVEPENDIIKQLSSFKWKRESVMPENGYKTYVGPADEAFLKKSAEDARQTFGVDLPIEKVVQNPAGVAVMGVLKRDVEYFKHFYRSKAHGLKFKTSSGEEKVVSFFGTAGNASEDFNNCVRVVAYEDGGKSFALSVQGKQNESVVIYLPKGDVSSIQQAIDSYQKLPPMNGEPGKLNDGYIHKKDSIKIPYLNVNADRDFTSALEGQIYYQGSGIPKVMTAAYQSLEVSLHEKGGTVRVKYAGSDAPFGGPIKPKVIEPRKFICDRPFYVFFWKNKEDLPYLAMYVDSLDVMEEFVVPAE